MIEKTLVLIKPDAVERGLIGEIVKRIEQRGLKISGMKMKKIDIEFSKKHYSEHVEKPFYQGLENFITSGPVIAIAVEGINAVETMRKIVGSTEPKSAIPGTIRGDFAHISYSYADQKGITIKNLVHASGNKEDADKEVELWFNLDELHDYYNVHEKHVF